MKGIVTAAISLLMMCIPALVRGNTQMNANDNMNQEKEQNRLLELDRKLSEKAAKDSILMAFQPVMSDLSALFPLIGHPVMGKKECAAIIKNGNSNIEKNSFKWQPLYARVSGNGDLGFTVGRISKEKDANTKAEYDYYGTIWRKESGGQWRIAVSQGLLKLKKSPQKVLVKSDTVAIHKDSKVVNTELAFSQYSQQYGATAAFYRFMAEKGIALSFSGPPRTRAVYKNALAKERATKEQKNPEGILKWEPYYSFIAASRDLAYNYGPYTYTATDDAGTQQINRGYFITVWQLQPDKTWKFVFDGGNRL
jgi:ketosteroid isomerase-like protein